MESINPSNGNIIRSYHKYDSEQLKQLVQHAHNSYNQWKHTDFKERRDFLLGVANQLMEEKEELTHLMAIEMGKPIREGEAEIKKCAAVCRYYAEKGEEFLASESISGADNLAAKVHYRPLGVLLGIMPWNYPFWQVFRFIAPNLMAGNTILIKHAKNVTGCALAIENTINQVGSQLNLYQTLLADSEDILQLISHKDICGISLTGSEKAGKAVASKAGNSLKKVVLELGGSDPYLVCEDADLELAVEKCLRGRLVNNGQSCIAAKRIIVDQTLFSDFQEMFHQKMSQWKYGNPLDPQTLLGPMARYDLRETLHQQVQESLSQGAKCLLGGEVPDEPGFFYPPTLLTEVRPGQKAFEQELFGPVACLISAKDQSEAILLANQSPYGLGAAVFTKDREKAEKIASQIDSGMVSLNDHLQSTPEFPFGGVKHSGLGRELSKQGIREFVNVQTVVHRG